jgi:site-specific recombinase XerD
MKQVLAVAWSRTTAWRRVQEVMRSAGIAGAQASPQGLRHGFGVAAVQADVPLTWFDERALSARMWGLN